MKRKTVQREYVGINSNYGFDFIILAELSRVVISYLSLITQNMLIKFHIKLSRWFAENSFGFQWFKENGEMKTKRFFLKYH